MWFMKYFHVSYTLFKICLCEMTANLLFKENIKWKPFQLGETRNPRVGEPSVIKGSLHSRNSL